MLIMTGAGILPFCSSPFIDFLAPGVSSRLREYLQGMELRVWRLSLISRVSAIPGMGPHLSLHGSWWAGGPSFLLLANLEMLLLVAFHLICGPGPLES